MNRDAATPTGRLMLNVIGSVAQFEREMMLERSPIQLAVRHQEVAGRNLKEEINDLAEKGRLPPVMREWSHEVRELGNESAHTTPGSATGPNPKDARNVVQFLTTLLTMLSDLLHQIEPYRARKAD